MPRRRRLLVLGAVAAALAGLRKRLLEANEAASQRPVKPGEPG